MQFLRIMATLGMVGLACASVTETVRLYIEGFFNDCEIDGSGSDTSYSCHEVVPLGKFCALSYLINSSATCTCSDGSQFCWDPKPRKFRFSAETTLPPSISMNPFRIQVDFNILYTYYTLVSMNRSISKLHFIIRCPQKLENFYPSSRLLPPPSNINTYPIQASF